MPVWVIAGWYTNDDGAQRRAIAHWHFMRRVGWTTERERELARVPFVYDGPRCFTCALAMPRVPAMCRWCRERFWYGETHHVVRLEVDRVLAVVARVSRRRWNVLLRCWSCSRKSEILADVRPRWFHYP